MRIWSSLTTWLSRKSAPSSYTSGNSGGMPLGADIFRKHRPPTSAELLAENLGTAYACSTLNADLLSSTPLRLYVTTGRGEPQAKMSKRGETQPVGALALKRLKANAANPRVRQAVKVEEVLAHPLLDLLHRPNPMADGVGLSIYELFNLTQLYQEIVGKAFWKVEKEGVGDTPSAIWILASHQVREVCDGSSDRIVDFYEFNGTDRYTPDEVVPFRMPDLRNPYTGGVSPLRSVIESVRINRKIDAHTGALLDNQARPDALFIPKGSTEGYDIGSVPAARLEARINQRFRMAGRGGIMVAEHDGQVFPLQWPTRDIADLEQCKLTKVIIANAFGVPTSKLDRNEANLASAATGDYAHAKDAGFPRCKRNEAALNAFFVPMWDPTGRLFLAYDSPIPADREAEREDRKVLVAAGGILRNELREQMGLEPRPDMDAPLAPKDMVGVDEKGNPLPPAPESSISLNMPGGGGADPKEEQPKAPEHQADAVTGGDLRATVGGSQAVLALQEAFYAGQMPREAAIANATLVFGFTPEEAKVLFPATAPDAPKAEGAAENTPADPSQSKPAAPVAEDAKKGKAIVGNVGDDGLAGPLPQGKKIAAALKKIFADQRAAVLKDVEGKSLEEAETRLIEELGARGKSLAGPVELHAFLRVAGRKNETTPPPTTNPLGGHPSVFVDLSQWDQTIADLVRPLIEIIATAGARKTITRVGASADVFSVVEKNIPAAAQKLSLAFAQSTNATTSLQINDALSKLRDEITAGLVEGDTRAEMKARVAAVFDQASDSRAATIAKTEASRAQHTGELMSAVEAKVVTKKKWLASNDACDACLELAEESKDGIPLDEPFGQSNYGPIETPPGHPNCQCSQTFEVSDPE